MTAIPVSVVVMTKDEERNIAKCLRTLTSFDEVFVVDSGSTDATEALAREHGAHVVPFRWDGGYPKKKQWCLEHLPFSHEWVLYVDADEEVTPALAEEIRELLARGPEDAGYFAGYDYWFIGHRLRHGQRVHKLVLFDRRRGRFGEVDDLAAENAWEVEMHYQPVIDGSVGRLRAPMVHRENDALFHFFDRLNRYSDWEAVARRSGVFEDTQVVATPLQRLVGRVFALLPFKAGVAFLYSYLVQRGFLDGRAGFHYAVMRGFYYWQIGLKERELEEREARAGPAEPVPGGAPDGVPLTAE